MKKSVIVLLIAVLLIFPLVQAQTYSGLNRFTDDVKLFLSSDKVNLALEIREKEVDSAIENFQNQNTEATNKNLEKATKKLQVVQKKVSLDNSEEIKTSVDEIIDKINEEENLPDEFDDYILEEEKTQLTAVLTEKTYEYCSELAKEDFAAMLKEEECNPDTAIPGLEKELKKLKDLQLRMFVQLMLEIRSCIDDPGTCNCEVNVDAEQKAKCEKMVALAIKCEYKEDETSCSELKAMEPKQGDIFAESFVPDFLRNLFKEKSYMIEYGIQPSDCVPEECWDYNDKPECRQYDKFKETKEDWDEYGNFIGTKNKCGKEGSTPTMQESIPECFDGDIFLEEKCGKITMVENEDGLVNYIIENEINGILEKFTNDSEQNTYAPGTTADGSAGQVQSKAMQIKKDMNQINNQIKDIIVQNNVVKTGMDIDVDKRDPDATPKTPAGDIDDGPCKEGEENCNNDMAPGPQGIVGVFVPEPRDDGPPSDSVDDSNDVAGVDEGPGEPGIVGE